MSLLNINLDQSCNNHYVLRNTLNTLISEARSIIKSSPQQAESAPI